jgi:hypothetical protein
MWRIQRDESKFTNAQKLAWDIVLPYMYLYILDSDNAAAEKMVRYLNKTFSTKALSAAVKRATL